MRFSEHSWLNWQSMIDAAELAAEKAAKTNLQNWKIWKWIKLCKAYFVALQYFLKSMKDERKWKCSPWKGKCCKLSCPPMLERSWKLFSFRDRPTGSVTDAPLLLTIWLEHITSRDWNKNFWQMLQFLTNLIMIEIFDNFYNCDNVF